MFLIPHIVFLCLYSFLIESYGSYFHWKEIYPDFFLPIFVFLLQRSPYPHLVLLIALVGCFADILQGNSWSQVTCLYILVYLGLDRLRVAQRCNNFFIYAGVVLGLSLLQPIWLRSTGDYHGVHEPVKQAIVNLTLSILLFFIFKLIRLGWGVPKQQLVHRPING